MAMLINFRLYGIFRSMAERTPPSGIIMRSLCIQDKLGLDSSVEARVSQTATKLFKMTKPQLVQSGKENQSGSDVLIR